LVVSFTILTHRAYELHDVHSFPTRRSSDLEKKVNTTPFSITVRSELDDEETGAKYGLGSSAAVVTSVITAVLEKFLRYPPAESRSEEHTSELQSRFDIVCRLLLEKKNTEKT